MPSVKSRQNETRDTSAEKRAPNKRSAPRDAQPRTDRSSRFVTLGLGLLGSLLSWLALPPVGLSPLAWVAPVPWLILIRRRELSGRRPYLVLWLAGFAFWLGRAALAASAASRNEPRLARTVWLSRLLLAGLRRPFARGGARAAHLVDHRSPRDLGRPRAGASASADRHQHRHAPVTANIAGSN